jgi:hypothetical protein
MWMPLFAIYFMTTDDMINGLKHTADDHPCCRGTIDATIAKIESLDRENARLREWIDGLDMLAANNGVHREWGGDMGWVYPGAAVYYAATKRDDILANASDHEETEAEFTRQVEETHLDAAVRYGDTKTR